MAKARIGEALLESAVAGEDQQAFAVGIESSRGVHLGHVNKVAQATPAASRFRRELTQKPVGLVQQQRRQVQRFFAGPPQVDHANGDQQQAEIQAQRGAESRQGDVCRRWSLRAVLSLPRARLAF